MGIDQRADFMRMVAAACSAVQKESPGLNAQKYLDAINGSIEDCRIGNGYFSVTLKPGLFMKDDGIPDGVFRGVALQLRDGIESHYHCCGYSLDLDAARNPHGLINKGLDIIAVGPDVNVVIHEFVGLVRAKKSLAKTR